MKLGRLSKVDLREYWKKEDTDFTPWLSKEKNIELLSETIAIELEVQSQEENVGPFRADILCKDTSNDDFVLIENQLEKTDHTHLGQLLTYASGLDAVSVIWIAQKFTEEHRAALDWLNRITDDSFNFFGIEIELFKIGDSIPAPMFNLVSSPNDWAKSVKKSASSRNLTDTKLLQQEFWAGLKDYLEENNSSIRSHKPSPQHWTNISIGRSHFHLSATVNSREKTISIWLNMQGLKAKENYDKLYNQFYSESLSFLGEDIVWDKMDGRKMSAIIKTTHGDLMKRDNWITQFAWFMENLEKFIEFFKPKIKELP